jgi:hypothetical protein
VILGQTFSSAARQGYLPRCLEVGFFILCQHSGVLGLLDTALVLGWRQKADHWGAVEALSGKLEEEGYWDWDIGEVESQRRASDCECQGRSLSEKGLR